MTAGFEATDREEAAVAHRMGSVRWLLLPWTLAVGYGAGKRTPTFTWTGRWEKTDLIGAYHSYVKLDDGRIACFEDMGDTALNIAVTREPGNMLSWTPYAQLMAFDAIFDLPDPADPTKPTSNRFMTRPTVVRLPTGDFLGLGKISRDYPAVDGLEYVVSYTGTAPIVRAGYRIGGQQGPFFRMWNIAEKAGCLIWGSHRDYGRCIDLLHRVFICTVDRVSHLSAPS